MLDAAQWNEKQLDGHDYYTKDMRDIEQDHTLKSSDEAENKDWSKKKSDSHMDTKRTIQKLLIVCIRLHDSK